MTISWPFPSAYPVGYDAYDDLTDLVDEVVANHPNSLSSAIEALQSKLGIDNDPVIGVGGLSFDPAGKAANPGGVGEPTLWVDNTTLPGYLLNYTDNLGATITLGMGVWGRTGTILSPATSGDTVQVTAVDFPLWLTSNANLLLGYDGSSTYSNLVRLSDAYMSASGWTAKNIQLSTSAVEWNNLRTNCGSADVSLVQAINLSFGGTSVIWIGTTTNDTPTEIFLDGVLNSRYDLTPSCTAYFNLVCIARDNVNNKSKVWEIKLATTTTSIAGHSTVVSLTPTYAVIDQTDPAGGTNDWDLAISVHTASDTVRVTVTGQTGCTIQWAVSN